MFEEDENEVDALQDVLLAEAPEVLPEEDAAVSNLPPLGRALRQSFYTVDDDITTEAPVRPTVPSLMSRPVLDRTSALPPLGSALRQSFVEPQEDTFVEPATPMFEPEVQQEVEEARQEVTKLEENLLEDMDSTEPLTPFYAKPEVKRVMEVDQQQQFADPYANLIQRDPRPEGDVESEIKYTPRDLVERDDLYLPIEAYMVDRFGVQIRERDREENIASFMAHRRKFDAYQGFVVVSDALWTSNQAQNENWEVLERAQEAQAIWNNMAGFFSGEYTGEEQQEAFRTYVRSIVVDPTNVLSMAGGALLSRALGTTTTSAINKLSVQAATRAQAVAASKNMSTAAQTQVFREAQQRALQRYVGGAGIGQTAAQRQAAIASGRTADSLRYWASSAVVDAGLNFSLDSLYQLGMMNIDMQPEFDTAQAGTAALMALAIPAIGAGITGTRALMSPIVDNAGIVQPGAISKGYMRIAESDDPSLQAQRITSLEVQPVAEDIVSTLTQGLRDIANDVPVGNWQLSVARGEVLQEGAILKTEKKFWDALLLSDNGLAVALRDAGFGAGGNRTQLGKRFEGDHLTNNIVDIMKNLPEGQKRLLERELQEVGGSVFPTYKNMTMDDFADRLAFTENLAGTTLQTMSAVRRKLNTAAELVEDVARGTSPLAGRATDDPPSLMTRIGQPMRYIQDYIIRAIVTHPATTMLNVKGWAAYEGVYAPLRDAYKVALYGGASVLDNIHVGANPMTNLRVAKANLQNQMARIHYLMNPATSLETTKEYAAFSPAIGQALGETMYGGVIRRRSTEDSLKKFGFDPMANPASMRMEQALEFFQGLYGSSTQDMVTKSISFNTNMDRLIRQEFNLSPQQFFDSPDLLSMVTSQKYRDIERNALNETLDAVSSRSFHKSATGVKAEKGTVKNFVSTAASIVEDAKEWPLFLGVNTAPFGRFANNTINFMVESTPLGLPAYYSAVAYEGRKEGDVWARALAGSTIIAGMTYTAYNNIELGLGYQQRMDSDGEVFDTTYEYPYSFWAAASYAIAFKLKNGVDTPLPNEVQRAIGEQVITAGLTRDFSDTTNSITRVLYSAVGENRDIGDDGLTPFREAFEIWGRTIASGTRPLDPLNQSVAMVRNIVGEDSYGVPDRNIGFRFLNDALRYVDQPADMLTEMITGTPLLTRRRNAAQQGDIAIGTAVTSQRNLPPLTYTNWMINSVGIPDWDLSMRARQVPEAARNFNDMYFHSLERRAAQLFDDPEFRSLSFERKTMRVRDIIRESSNETKNMFIFSDDENDKRYSLMLSIAGPNTNNSRSNIDVMLRTYFDGRDIPDLEVEELELLDGMLGNLDVWMR